MRRVSTYLLVLYSLVLVATLLIVTNSFAGEDCEIHYTNNMIVADGGPFDQCLAELGHFLTDELKYSNKLQHTEILFVMDRVVLQDQVLKNAMLTRDGAAVEFFIGEKFFSNELWAQISKNVNFEFRINDNIIYDQGLGQNNLTINLVEMIVLSQLL